MLTISRIIELGDIIKWTPLFRAAGLNDSTLRSAMRNRRELHPEESEALTRVLLERGVRLFPSQQRFEFPP